MDRIRTLRGIFGHSLSILKQGRYRDTAIATTLLLFVLFAFLYGMFRVPILDIGIVRMSPVTLFDLAYIVSASTLMGILIALFRYKVSTTVSKGAGLGSFAVGFFGAVCPMCQTISLAAFGSTVAALPLAFLVPYINAIRASSLLLLGLSLYLAANNIYTKTCLSCKVPRIHRVTQTRQLSDKWNPRFLWGSMVAFGIGLSLIVMQNLQANPNVSGFAIFGTTDQDQQIDYKFATPEEVVRQYFESWDAKDWPNMYGTISDGFKKIDPYAKDLSTFANFASSQGISGVRVIDASEESNDGATAVVAYSVEFTLNDSRNFDGTLTLKFRQGDIIPGWKLIHPYGQNIDA